MHITVEVHLPFQSSIHTVLAGYINVLSWENQKNASNLLHDVSYVLRGDHATGRGNFADRVRDPPTAQLKFLLRPSSTCNIFGSIPHYIIPFAVPITPEKHTVIFSDVDSTDFVFVWYICLNFFAFLYSEHQRLYQMRAALTQNSTEKEVHILYHARALYSYTDLFRIAKIRVTSFPSAG